MELNYSIARTYISKESKCNWNGCDEYYSEWKGSFVGNKKACKFLHEIVLR